MKWGAKRISKKTFKRGYKIGFIAIYQKNIFFTKKRTFFPSIGNDFSENLLRDGFGTEKLRLFGGFSSP